MTQDVGTCRDSLSWRYVNRCGVAKTAALLLVCSLHLLLVGTLRGEESETEKWLTDAKRMTDKGKFTEAAAFYQKALEATQRFAGAARAEAESIEITVVRGTKAETVRVPADRQHLTPPPSHFSTAAHHRDLRRRAALAFARLQAEMGDFDAAVQWQQEADRIHHWCGTCDEFLKRESWIVLTVLKTAQLPKEKALRELTGLMRSGRLPPPGRLILGDEKALQQSVKDEAALILGGIYQREAQMDAARKALSRAMNSKVDHIAHFARLRMKQLRTTIPMGKSQS